MADTTGPKDENDEAPREGSYDARVLRGTLEVFRSIVMKAVANVARTQNNGAVIDAEQLDWLGSALGRLGDLHVQYAALDADIRDAREGFQDDTEGHQG